MALVGHPKIAQGSVLSVTVGAEIPRRSGERNAGPAMSDARD